MNDASVVRRPITIAAAQILCIDGDRSGNLYRIERAIARSKAAGADLVAFPESCLLGWMNPEAHDRATPIPGNDSDRICAWAREYSLHVCIGLDEKAGDQLFDAAILVDASGRILLKHRKHNLLAHLMSPPYTAGNTLSVAETTLGRIGVLICADSFEDDLLQKMRDLRPDLMLIPYGWAAPETAWPDHGLELRRTVANAARRIGAPVIGTDLVGAISHGPWRGRVYGGQSVGADPHGTVLFSALDREPDLVFVTLTPGRHL